MKKLIIGFWLLTMLFGFGCSSGGGQSAIPGVPARENNTQGTALPHDNSSDTEEETESELEQEQETTNTSYFYFSYDDSNSTAASDLTEFYIENGLTPYQTWGRAYEYLNSEQFNHFASHTLGPFEISAGLYYSAHPHFPTVAKLNLDNSGLYSFGVNLSGPTLSKSERPNIVGTFLVDVSGSMESRYAPETRSDITTLLDVAKHGLQRMINALKPGDIVNIVIFDTNAEIVLEDWAFDAENTNLYTSVVNSLQARNSTNLNKGIELAYRVAQRTFDPEKSNRVIILTDAYANTGEVSPSIIAENTVINGLEGIYFAGVGIGNTFDDRFLNELTDIGKGNYVAMITPEDAERIFISQFTSFIDAAVSDVRFRLDYPAALKHLIFASAAEELSTNAQDVQTTNFAYNTQQFFLEHFSHSSLLEEGAFRLTVSYKNNEGTTEEEFIDLTVAELLGQGQDAILTATMVTTLADLVAQKVKCSELYVSDIFNLLIETPIYIKYQTLADQYCSTQ